MEDQYPVVDFSITTPLENVRLMEVSNDVLEVIRAARDGKERDAILRFKSFPPSMDTSSGVRSSSKIKDGVLHLCSDDKVWAIRQVSTSNSVYIVQSSHQQDSNDGNTTSSSEMVMSGTDEAGTIAEKPSRGHISAIAKVGNFLELQDLNVDDREVESMILRLVPIFEHPASQQDHTSLPRYRSKPAITRQTLENDIPAPTTTITKAIARLSLFEHPEEQSNCYIPSPHTILYIWTRLIEGCTIESIPLDDPTHSLNTEQITNVLPDDLDRLIVHAMLRENGMFDALNLIIRQSTTTTTDTTTTTTVNNPRLFDSGNLATFIASLLLATEIDAVTTTTTSSSSTPSSSLRLQLQPFISRWCDLLPTSFLTYATEANLKRLLGSSVLFRRLNVSISTADNEEEEVIVWSTHNVSGDGKGKKDDEGGALGCGISRYEDLVVKLGDGGGDDGGQGQGVAVKAGTAGAGPGKRKWHEKFAAQRNKR